MEKINYVYFDKRIIEQVQSNKYTSIVYGYISTNRGFATESCFTNITMIAKFFNQKNYKKSDNGLLCKYRDALKRLLDAKMIKNETENFITANNKNQGKYDIYDKYNTWSLNYDKDEQFILINYTEFFKLCRDYSIDTLNVYLYIIRHIARGNKDSSCFTSYNTMCKDLNISRPTLIKSINKLEELKYIIIVRGNRDTPNHYYLVNDIYVK